MNRINGQYDIKTLLWHQAEAEMFSRTTETKKKEEIVNEGLWLSNLIYSMNLNNLFT